MKIRQSFVTNSSSSSFILMRSEANSKDDVYDILRNLYLEYAKKYEKAIEYVRNSQIGIEYTDDKGFTITGTSRDERWDAVKEFERQTNLKYYDLWEKPNIAWTSCNTYKEYEEYFSSQSEEGPFTIGDYLNPETLWVHWGEGIKSNIDITEENDEVCWYYYDKKKEYKENAPLELLGRFCVYSECGYIPEWIVNRLSEHCNYYCNHMG